MGNANVGSFSQVANIAPESKVCIVQEYARLVALGSSDDEIKAHLATRLAALMATETTREQSKRGYLPLLGADASEPRAIPSSAPLPSITKSSSTSQQRVSSKGGGGVAKGGGKAGTNGIGKTVSDQSTRRRSFEPKKQQQQTMDQKSMLSSVSKAHFTSLPLLGTEAFATAAATVSATATTAAAETTTSDHWASVSQLPYCNVCKSAFKSEGLLERHIKYSEMHAKNRDRVQLKEDGALVEEAPKKLVEGKDYQLYYYGSKFFWRSQDNIDISMFYHVLADVIEVVPFDVYKNRELERLYFSCFKLAELFKDELQIKLAERKRQMQSSTIHTSSFDNSTSATFSSVGVSSSTTAQKRKQDLDTFAEEEQRKLSTTYILARLTLHDMPAKAQTLVQICGETHVNKPDHILVFVPTASDDVITKNESASPLLAAPPSLLVPISVTHRRNTSNEEVKMKMNSMQEGMALLRSATSHAEKISGLITKFAASLRNKSTKLASFSSARRRWVMAIARVLQIIGVEKTTRLLNKREEKAKEAKRKAIENSRRRKEDVGVTEDTARV